MINKIIKFLKKYYAFILIGFLTIVTGFIGVFTSKRMYDIEDKDSFSIKTERVDVSTSTTTTTLKKTNTTTNTTTSKTIFPIDVNKVTYDELIQIKGVGNVTANKIIEYRNKVIKITNMDQLLNISGIGNKTLEILKEYLYVSADDYKSMQTSQSTTTKPITTTITNKQTSVTTNEPVMKQVNINTANAKEIAECLLIEIDVAEKIVDFRETYSLYVNPRELLYIEEITIPVYERIKEYILI